MSVQENTNIPTRQKVRELEISQSSVVKILEAEKCHAYKLTILLELNEDNPYRRLKLCEQFIELLRTNI